MSSAGRRCDGLDTALARKADVSVLPSLEAAAAIVAEEGGAVRSLRRDMTAVSGRLEAAEDGLRGELERGEQTATVLEGLGRALAGKASRTELGPIREGIRQAGEDVRAAGQAAAAQLGESEERLLGQLRAAAEAAATAQAAAESAAEIGQAAQRALDECARTADVWPRERGEALEAAAAALRRAMDSRASKESASAAMAGVTRLQSQLRSAEARLAVAMDFVDWYAAKGDALEHNERVIHAELGRMAVAGAQQSAAARAARAAVA